MSLVMMVVSWMAASSLQLRLSPFAEASSLGTAVSQFEPHGTGGKSSIVERLQQRRCTAGDVREKMPVLPCRGAHEKGIPTEALVRVD